MMSKLLSMALGLGLTFGAATAFAQGPAPNATLKDIGGKGNVLVNQGEEFVPATEGMRLKPGDRVMVRDDSEADLQFDDECAYEISENKIVTIPGSSPCAGGTPLVQSLEPTGSGAVGTVAGNPSPVPFLTAAAIETAIYFWWADDDDEEEDDDDTVSP